MSKVKPHEFKNTVEFIGYYGSDESIAKAAWVSTDNVLTDEKKERIPTFVKGLWEEGHETPSERGILHFIVNMEIASHIQTLKHRIGVSVNTESARYKQLKEDKFYIPEDWRGVPVDSLSGIDKKQFGDTWEVVLWRFSELSNYLYHSALTDLIPYLGKTRAKETARFFKTYNSQLKSDVVFNIRSFAHYMELRNTEHAQKEIREIADTMFNLVKNIEGSPFAAILEAIEERNNRPKMIQVLVDKIIHELSECNFSEAERLSILLKEKVK